MGGETHERRTGRLSSQCNNGGRLLGWPKGRLNMAMDEPGRFPLSTCGFIEMFFKAIDKGNL
jgi:hypothetical protein